MTLAPFKPTGPGAGGGAPARRRTPVVFARSVFPLSPVLTGSLTHLRRLQNKLPGRHPVQTSRACTEVPFELALMPGTSDYLPAGICASPRLPGGVAPASRSPGKGPDGQRGFPGSLRLPGHLRAARAPQPAWARSSAEILPPKHSKLAVTASTALKLRCHGRHLQIPGTAATDPLRQADRYPAAAVAHAVGALDSRRSA